MRDLPKHERGGHLPLQIGQPLHQRFAVAHVAGFDAGTDPVLPGGGTGPNVILVIVDTLRKDHVGAYGNDWIQTPTLDALAEESMLFTRTYPEAMPTLPVRRAIHTGMRTWPTRPPSFGWKPIPSGQTTVAEMLEKEGFGTYLVTDTYVQFRTHMNFGRGFATYRTHYGLGDQGN